MKALLVMFILILPLSAEARPTQDQICTNCHTNAGGGGSISAPASIDIALDSSGDLTFSLSGAYTGNAAIGLFGLVDPDLLATAGAGWTLNTNADPDYEYSDFFNSATNSYDVTLSVPNTALLGTYSINVIMAGDNGAFDLWNDITSFNVNVVPIPAAVWLFGSGLIGLVAIARRRRNA